MCLLKFSCKRNLRQKLLCTLVSIFGLSISKWCFSKTKSSYSVSCPPVSERCPNCAGNIIFALLQLPFKLFCRMCLLKFSCKRKLRRKLLCTLVSIFGLSIARWCLSVCEDEKQLQCFLPFCIRQVLQLCWQYHICAFAAL